MSLLPINQVLISLDAPLQDEIITEGGIKLYISPDFSPEWNASVVGKISALPISKKHSAFAEKVKDADEVLFSYSVVNERDYGSDSHYFQEEVEGNEYFQKYVNPKGEKLAIVAMPRVISVQWAGYYIDKFGELIDGYVGDEAGMSRWKSQFTFGFSDNFRFVNLVEWDGGDYWRCSVDDVFAMRVGGKLLPTSDRLILEPIVIDIKNQVELLEGKPIPYQTLTFVPSDRATIIHDCEELGLSKGDIVGFDPRYCEKYSIFNKEYYLIKQNRAQGVWQEI